MFNISEKSYKQIISAIANTPEIEKTILFGSRALGNSKQGSDIDLAIVGAKVDYSVCLQLSVLLNQKLPIPYRVDIVDYMHINNEQLKTHIDDLGIVIYQK
jgi:predicted nucleotidyltransferase